MSSGGEGEKGREMECEIFACSLIRDTSVGSKLSGQASQWCIEWMDGWMDGSGWRRERLEEVTWARMDGVGGESLGICVARQLD